jgi:hypothetical protein
MIMLSDMQAVLKIWMSRIDHVARPWNELCSPPADWRRRFTVKYAAFINIYPFDPLMISLNTFSGTIDDSNVLCVVS